jgi:hypothetical protein
MEKLNRNAEAKYNEVYRVYGEQVLLAYEIYVDARADLLEGRRDNTADEFQALKVLGLLGSELSDITAYADFHIECMVSENEEADREFKAAAQPIKLPAKYTSRIMDAMAASIGMTYTTYVNHPEGKKHKNGYIMQGKRIGPYFHMTNAGLVGMIWEQVQEEGDRDILLNAKYSDGYPAFALK